MTYLTTPLNLVQHSNSGWCIPFICSCCFPTAFSSQREAGIFQGIQLCKVGSSLLEKGVGQIQSRAGGSACEQFHSVPFVWSAFTSTSGTAHICSLNSTIWRINQNSSSVTQPLCYTYLQRIRSAYEADSVLQIQVQEKRKEAAVYLLG